MDMTAIKHAGVKVMLGGAELVIPPLNLRSLQQFQDRLREFKGELDPASVSLVLDVVQAALLRNYPDVTKDQISEWVDVANMQEVMLAVMDVSGLRRKEQETKEKPASP